jgi:flagellar basal body-associated protein FliL
MNINYSPKEVDIMEDNLDKSFAKRQAKYDKKLAKKLQKQAYLDKLRGIKVNTFTKAMVFFIMLISLIDLQLSYILAFMGMINIAEELSRTVCSTIIGVAFVYMVRAFFDTKYEHAEKNAKEKIEEEIINRVSDVLSNAGVENVDIHQLYAESFNNEDNDGGSYNG